MQVVEQVQELFEIPKEDDKNDNGDVSAGANTSSVGSRISNTGKNSIVLPGSKCRNIYFLFNSYVLILFHTNATKIGYINLADDNAFFLKLLAESHPKIIEQLDEDAGGDFDALGIDKQTSML